MFKRASLALIVIAVPAVAAAQTVYTWTDAEGVLHFTDSLKAVPLDAKVTTTEGGHVNVLSSGAPAPAATSPAEAELQRAVAQAKAAAAEAQSAAARAQARERATDEDTWRARFREAREAVRVLEDDIEADRRRVEEVAGLPVLTGVTCLPMWQAGVPAGPPGTVVVSPAAPGAAAASTGTFAMPCFLGASPEHERIRDRLARNRSALVRAKEALTALERRAAFEAVPLEWRR